MKFFFFKKNTIKIVKINEKLLTNITEITKKFQEFRSLFMVIRHV